MQIKSEIRYTLDFVKTNLITKQDLERFTLSHKLQKEDINYISVVVSLNSLNTSMYYHLCHARPVNCTYEALVYTFSDLYLLPIIDDLSSPLQSLTLKLLKEPSKSVDFIKSAYNTLPACYK
jgi:hypothetical protein